MPVGPKELESWTDILGQTYKPGDFVAYAVMCGRSADLAIGKVKRINGIDSRGKPIMAQAYVEGKWTEVPSCTVTILPFQRAYGRYYGKEGKLNTILKIDKIIKIPSSLFRNKRTGLEKKLRALEQELS